MGHSPKNKMEPETDGFLFRGPYSDSISVFEGVCLDNLY